MDPPALLVHGAVDDSNTWSAVGKWMGDRGWHAIAVDLRGHGRSGVDSGDPDRSLDSLAEDLVETLANLRPDVGGADVVIGHSLGSLVAIACAAKHPSFARRVVLEDPPGATFDVHELAEDCRAWIASARRDPKQFAEFWREQGDPRADPDEILAKVRAIAAADPTFVPDLVEDLGSVSIVDIASRCSAPVLLALGRDTANAAELNAEAMAEFSVLVGDDRRRLLAAIPTATVVTFEAGHDIHQTMPTEFLAVLENWLNVAAVQTNHQER